jgi:hypothetical protein
MADIFSRNMLANGGPSFNAIIAAGKASGIPVVVTSTTGGVHVGGSDHYLGLAVDWGGSQADMDRFAKWVADNYGTVSRQIIHKNGDGSPVTWDSGHPVPPSFYSSEFNAHQNHVHWAITKLGLAAKGAPTPAGDASGGSSLPGPLGTVQDAYNALQAIDKAIAKIMNPDLWKRGGKLGAALLVIAAAIIFLNRGFIIDTAGKAAKVAAVV